MTEFLHTQGQSSVNLWNKVALKLILYEDLCLSKYQCHQCCYFCHQYPYCYGQYRYWYPSCIALCTAIISELWSLLVLLKFLMQQQHYYCYNFYCTTITPNLLNIIVISISLQLVAINIPLLYLLSVLLVGPLLPLIFIAGHDAHLRILGWFCVWGV